MEQQTQVHLAPTDGQAKSVQRPSGITYRAGTGRYAVFVGSRLVGHIRLLRNGTGGFRYFPLGVKTGGEIFATLAQCKRSLESA